MTGRLFKHPCADMSAEEIQKYVKDQSKDDAPGPVTEYLKNPSTTKTDSAFNPPKDTSNDG